MPRQILRLMIALCFSAPLLLACRAESESPKSESGADADIGVDRRVLSSRITNPWVGFGSVKRAVYEGEELDPETEETVDVRMEYTVRETPETVAGVSVTVVDVSDFEDGELVEKTQDYYAQGPDGVVYYLGERVDDLEDGKVVGHGGQWLAGEKKALAGLFMPATPKMGDVFEQERAPGIAEDRSTVIATHKSVELPAGIFQDCIEVEDFDPISGSKQRKIYCRGVGLVREIFGEGRSLDLIEIESR